ncbi:TLR adapter interacting with SLC15A4 on the lysosome [Boleophthalmus pectinirostris]|uniref:TLR adapter interacting with SLC15A4 on the lysosome n=1 Tax=Boleophthalmus pectinirostris TaxID=150288 RepID=UPI00242CFDB1|nr:TLR adapter interacting with SLC15A4 on the lysosome [Boleophthalmus pectinirostris]XP_055005409.1 TLR adapter interacting with SLC15A4 on the lysosome [Boleophthalmus pectinirostris]
MLCEGRLWSVIYNEGEESRQDDVPGGAAHGSADAFRHRQTFHTEHSSCPGPLKSPGASGPRQISSLQSLDLERVWPDRQISPEMEIPAQGHSAGDAPFLVPSFCNSICQNYSDLHIAGDQVLPLSANVGEFCPNKLQTAGPLLHSYDVLPPLEQSPQGGHFFPVKQGSHQWRQGSGRDRSFFLQGREGPFSNSLLNHYLEQKLQDLYQQYMMENMAKEGAHGGPMCPLLGSELVLTSLDQITLQLSREVNMEAGAAKDMVLSCLLRVAGDMQSSEISTPFLQISNEEMPSKEKEMDEK